MVVRFINFHLILALFMVYYFSELWQVILCPMVIVSLKEV